MYRLNWIFHWIWSNECEPEPETISFEYDSEESDECPTGSSQSESIPSSPIKKQKRIIPFEVDGH
jgi:hypothetical protein